MTRPLDEPGLADVDAILRFLPLLSAPGFDAGHFHPAETHEGVTMPPMFGASPVLLDLIQALLDHHWVLEFDWTEWQPVAERYAHHPELLADAGIGTVRKILTTHVRKDHYVEGHLAEVVRSGHLVAVLRRLETLRAGLAPAEG